MIRYLEENPQISTEIEAVIREQLLTKASDQTAAHDETEEEPDLLES